MGVGLGGTYEEATAEFWFCFGGIHAWKMGGAGGRPERVVFVNSTGEMDGGSTGEEALSGVGVSDETEEEE